MFCFVLRCFNSRGPLAVTFWVLSGFCLYFLYLFSLVSSVCFAWYSVILLHSCSPVTSLCLCLLWIWAEHSNTPRVSVSRFGYFRVWRSFSKSSFPTRFMIFSLLPHLHNHHLLLYYVYLRNLCPVTNIITTLTNNITNLHFSSVGV